MLDGLWIFLDQHNGGVTAAATIFIAVFTIVLALVTTRQASLTRIAANAAKDSADALPTLERAYLFVSTNLGSIVALRQSIKDRSEPPPRDKWTLVYEIVNFGKTPAIVTALAFTFSNSAEPRAVKPKSVGAGSLVINGGGFERRDNAPVIGQAGKGEVVSIADGRTSLFFCGAVLYEDVFRREHETRICWRFDPKTDNFVEHGGDENNRRT